MACALHLHSPEQIGAMCILMCMACASHACTQERLAEMTSHEAGVSSQLLMAATAEGELSNATLIRDKEHEDFLAAEAELVTGLKPVVLGRGRSRGRPRACAAAARKR